MANESEQVTKEIERKNALIMAEAVKVLRERPMFNDAPEVVMAALLNTVLTSMGAPGGRQRAAMMALLKAADDTYYAKQMMKE